MAIAAPTLPKRFPIYCRATYSWGGETQRDLGFIEGDLILCLNAGDGSWWTGKLHRDPRCIGSFPSNFVKVLDEDFQPQSRATSPLPGVSTSGSKSSPQKSRKPFHSYKKATAERPVSQTLQSPHTESRELSLSPSRQPSYSATATTPLQINSLIPRIPSPSPSSISRKHSSSSFAYDGEGNGSPPPPAPPPHRVTYNASRSVETPSHAPLIDDRHSVHSRAHSPAPTSPEGVGLTPSPLRDAMEDVMSSLHDMGMNPHSPDPSFERRTEPLDPWSPDAFEEFRTRPNWRNQRPRSSLGICRNQDEREDALFYDPNGRRTPDQEWNGNLPEVEGRRRHIESHPQKRQLHDHQTPDELFLPHEQAPSPPVPPPKNSPYREGRNSVQGVRPSMMKYSDSDRRLRNRKSAFELGRGMLGRTFTNKSTTTDSSSGVQSNVTSGTSASSRTSQSIMSGFSAGGFSATSAGSLARRKGWGSISRKRPISVVDDRQSVPTNSQLGSPTKPSNLPLMGESDGVFGGLTTPKPKKSGFFKKLVDSARTTTASARSSIAAGQVDTPRSPIKNLVPGGVTAIQGGNVARDMGLGGGKSCADWVQVRRDVNRSNSLSRNEREERAERCQMMDYPVVAPIDALYEAADGNEALDGGPVHEPMNFQAVNFQLIDKSARFVNSLPPMTNSMSLAQGYVCRPYKSDVQRLRAIFTWVSEKVAWEEDFEGEVDTRRVIQARRGCAEELAVLVLEMCSAMGMHAEVVRGYLKSPGEDIDLGVIPKPNHWWNAVAVDNEWRMVDCSLASPSNPKREQYSSAGPQVAETGWFLARPMEMCYTHVAHFLEQQHICPPVAADILLALPCACPQYFKTQISMVDFDTSLCRMENLELVQIQFAVPSDIECCAEVEVRSYTRDADGDLFESGDTIKTRALAQADWSGGEKRYTVKAHLPADEGHGILKVYAGRRGLMHSIRDNPHPLAFSLPMIHSGQNPPYGFFLRHPTPQAQRHDLYVVQPQCARLAVNNTFVFAVRQHPSSLSCTSPPPRSQSPLLFARPSSAMSMVSASASASGSDYFSQPSQSSNSSAQGSQQQQQKPAKLAIQAPSGKILRLTRKNDGTAGANGLGGGDGAEGGVWETVIKIGERGTWRGLVLADRTLRWCVFGEWECF
ncbi:MAG: hypothetical protein LQ351_007569 [Letrouitia transgressa]|nr:MAG: hypothetical protein LQ351_007569 [Letrouitia transgressa]